MMTLAELLIPKIQERFQNIPSKLDQTANPFAVFYSPSSEVGTIEIEEYEGGLVVSLGPITHCHFENYKNHKKTEEKELLINEVIKFLEELFEGQIEFFGTDSSGSWRWRKNGPRGFFSKLFLGKKSYTWFGPLEY